MRKFISVIGLSFALTACGGSGSSSDLRAKDATLANISGVWDASEVINGKKDEYYVVIKDHGEVSFYDYMGDEYDNMENCFENETFSLIDLGNDVFEMVTNLSAVSEIKAELTGDKLVLTRNNESQTLLKTNRLESDFQPTCTTNYSQPLKVFNIQQ